MLVWQAAETIWNTCQKNAAQRGGISPFYHWQLSFGKGNPIPEIKMPSRPIPCLRQNPCWELSVPQPLMLPTLCSSSCLPQTGRMPVVVRSRAGQVLGTQIGFAVCNSWFWSCFYWFPKFQIQAIFIFCLSCGFSCSVQKWGVVLWKLNFAITHLRARRIMSQHNIWLKRNTACNR